MKISKPGAIALAMVVAAGLSACGGGGGTKFFPPPDTGTPAPVIDAFFAAVSGIVSASSEDGAPKDPIDTIVASTPEDKEPEPLG